MLRILKHTSIDFVRLWRVSTIGILAFIVPALIWIAVSGIPTSVEFTGGSLVQLEFDQEPRIADVRALLGDAEIQTYGKPNEIVVRTQGPEGGEAASEAQVAAQIRQRLVQRYGDGVRIVRTEAIGPRVGAELRRNAIIAMLISFAMTLLYLTWRFEWRLAAAAVLANVHDIIATFAFVKYMQIEISLFVVGGILTVIGYSLADKVVVFDRVRELFRSKQRISLYDTLNRAVNETLPRTIMTGTTVIACLIALIVFGGDVLRPFAMVLLFGIAVGTFSSIYVAGPLLLWIERRKPRSNVTSVSGTETVQPRPAAATPAAASQRPPRATPAPTKR